jgi:hypothetical protein
VNFSLTIIPRNGPEPQQTITRVIEIHNYAVYPLRLRERTSPTTIPRNGQSHGGRLRELFYNYVVQPASDHESPLNLQLCRAIAGATADVFASDSISTTMLCSVRPITRATDVSDHSVYQSPITRVIAVCNHAAQCPPRASCNYAASPEGSIAISPRVTPYAAIRPRSSIATPGRDDQARKFFQAAIPCIDYRREGSLREQTPSTTMPRRSSPLPPSGTSSPPWASEPRITHSAPSCASCDQYAYYAYSDQIRAIRLIADYVQTSHSARIWIGCSYSVCFHVACVKGRMPGLRVPVLTASHPGSGFGPACRPLRRDPNRITRANSICNHSPWRAGSARCRFRRAGPGWWARQGSNL